MESSSLDGTLFDCVVIGASPSGIAAAVRAAREGLDTVLVSYYDHIGGTLTNGLSTHDTSYEGRRSAILDEWVDGLVDHYASTYGEDSDQYRAATKGPFSAGPWGQVMFEPHIAEQVFERIIHGEPRLAVIRGYRPVGVERRARIVDGVRLESTKGGDELVLRGRVFIDAAYEGDTMALAGAPYRVGREAIEEYAEQHAGRLFMQRSGAESHHPEGDIDLLQYPRAARAGNLDLRPHWGVTQEIFSESTGEGDGGVQAYNFRVCLTKDPTNRRMVEPPPGYDRERFLPVLRSQGRLEEPVHYPIKTDLLINDVVDLPSKLPIPNDKVDWNAAAIPGGVDDYPDGDWETRERIKQEHADFALGLLYFLQNDPDVPEDVRERVGIWGLPKDEFTDNDNFPREFYIREARRIIGRYVFTENDARFGRGLQRAPIHSDSIAISEWLMDSHDCSTDRVMGSYGDGWTTLSEVTRPGQIPYRCLLPTNIDNLLVPQCLSATHVGWGTIRVEPTLMHVAESAGFSAAIAVEQGITPAEVTNDDLQRRLAESGVMLTFFNDLDMATDAPWVAAVQYFGTKGFFASYDARPEDPLDAVTAGIWAKAIGAMLDNNDDPNRTARALPRQADEAGGIDADAFIDLLEHELAYRRMPLDRSRITSPDKARAVTRADACAIAYRITNRSSG